MQTNTDIAYLAGLIDGEGALQIDRKFSRHSARINYIPKLVITTTSEILRDWLMETFPNGSWHMSVRGGKYNPNSKNSFTIGFNQEWLKNYAHIIKPYLVIKRTQLSIIQELLSIKDTSPENMEAQEALKIKLTQANGRGTDSFKQLKFEQLMNVAKIARNRQLEKVSARLQELASRTCVECGAGIGTHHHHATFCSNACKLKNWRRKKKEGG